MIQQACNERGTALTLLDAIQDADVLDLVRLRAAILAGNVREAGRLVTLFYEDYTYNAFSDDVVAKLEQQGAGTYAPDRVGYNLECTV